MRGPRVAVAGAGALGLAAALALARRGARVTVFDPAPPGENASGVAAGMLAPGLEAALDPLSRPHFDLLLAARDLWPVFAARAGVDLDRAGPVVAGEAAWVEAAAAQLGALGVATAMLSPADLDDAAPGLAAPFRRGLVVEGDWHVEPLAALAALRRATEAAGVGVRAQAVKDAEDFDVLVVATGASRSLLQVAPELRHIAPIKGHILRAAFPVSQVIRSQGVYLAPAPGGSAIGASMEPGLADRRIDSGQVGRLRAAASRLFPAIAEVAFTAAAGVRGATPDGLPLAGPGAAPKTVIAAGARRNGWLLAPLVAETVAGWVMGEEPGPFAARLRPGRFDALSPG